MATTSQDIKTPPAEKASDSGRLIKQLKAVVGDSYVLTSPESTRQYRTGFRFGSGPVLASSFCAIFWPLARKSVSTEPRHSLSTAAH